MPRACVVGPLQTVDPEAVAVLVGKEAVLRATYGNGEHTVLG